MTVFLNIPQYLFLLIKKNNNFKLRTLYFFIFVNDIDTVISSHT